MKFIHAADLHIDSPLRGLDEYEGAPVEKLRGAPRRALVALVDLALRERVDLVLLVGDIYDGDWQDFRTGLFFRGEMLRLTRAGILVFVVKGNHDANNQITKELPEIEGLHVFSSHTAETVLLEALGVALHGRSFPNRAVPEDLVPGYPVASPGMFNIGLLHTSLNGRVGHDTYAPTSVEALMERGYDYFALGHVHKREVIRESNPRIVYPGNLQGRHAKESETGQKGCDLITVEGGVITSCESHALDVVRWSHITIDATGVATLEDLARQFVAQAQSIVAGAYDRLHAVRVFISGETPLYAKEAEQPGTLAAAIHAAAQEVMESDIWIEQVRLDLRSPFDRAAAAQREDAFGEVVRLSSELASNDDKLKAWFLDRVVDMKDLPPAMKDFAPSDLSIEDIRALVLDAEATALSKLSASAPGSAP